MSASMPAKIPENGFYYHYKHNPEVAFNDYAYEVAGIARHTEEQTYTVLYRPLYENDWFEPVNFQARPLEMFVEDVEKDGKIFPRFQKITNSDVLAKLEKIRDEMYL